MKYFITLASIILVAGSSVDAGCGDKVSVEGTLSKFDAEKKVLKVGRKDVTLEASAVIKDASGKVAKIEDLVGKSVVVSTDKHTKKAESVTEAADFGGSEEQVPPAKNTKGARPGMNSNLWAEKQEWTNAQGVKIIAAVQKIEKGKVYFIKEGKTIPYEVSKLSVETVDRLKEIVASRPTSNQVPK